jgi:hypothetical protein
MNVSAPERKREVVTRLSRTCRADAHRACPVRFETEETVYVCSCPHHLQNQRQDDDDAEAIRRRSQG